MSRKATALLVASVALRLASADEFVTPLYDFLSRPDILVPRLQVDTYDPVGVAPGYIFLTPAARKDIADGVNYNMGPAIYTNDGDLVWTGYNPALPKRAESMGFDVTTINNKTHLAYSTIGAEDMSHGAILDDGYNLVRQVTVGKTPRNFLQHMRRDMHVFNVITPRTLAANVPPYSSGSHQSRWVQPDDPETALLSTNVRKGIDPPIYICGQLITWVHDFPFQEVSLDGENTVIFEWSPLDHIPIDETFICPGMKDRVKSDPELIGTGPRHPFDFVHRNAVDKLPDGDYVVSARHMNTIYKISHVDGHVVWRLGAGWHTDFVQTSLVPEVDLEFSGQHDIRVENNVPGADPANGIIGLTMWDNANLRYDGVGATSDRSLAKTILVDQNRMTAELVSAFALPGNPLGTNQGSHQVLPNGNHLLGGGNIAQIAEYPAEFGDKGYSPTLDDLDHQDARQGLPRPVFAAHFGGGPMNSYRARRYEWHGTPSASPDAFAYRRSCDVDSGDRTHVYVSWNGATEVAAWTVWGAASHGAAEDEFRWLTTTKRTGFETAIVVQHDGDEEGEETEEIMQVLEVYVVAHDATGREVDRTPAVPVWVPRDDDVAISRRTIGLGSTSERRNEARRRGGGECGERRCRAGFEYSADRARNCQAPTWWLLTEGFGFW